MNTENSAGTDYVGVGTKDLKLDIEDGKAVVSGTVEHVGKYGSIEVGIKGKLDAKPLVEKFVQPVIDKLVDQVEKIIPGDQTGIAESLKTLAHEELKKLLESA